MLFLVKKNDIRRKYYVQLGNARKKFEPPEEFEPINFQVPVGRSSHWAMGNSHGEQVAGFGVTTTGLHISWVHQTKAKQHTDLLASCKHPKEVLCTLWD